MLLRRATEGDGLGDRAGRGHGVHTEAQSSQRTRRGRLGAWLIAAVGGTDQRKTPGNKPQGNWVGLVSGSLPLIRSARCAGRHPRSLFRAAQARGGGVRNACTPPSRKSAQKQQPLRVL